MDNERYPDGAVPSYLSQVSPLLTLPLLRESLAPRPAGRPWISEKPLGGTLFSAAGGSCKGAPGPRPKRESTVLQGLSER